MGRRGLWWRVRGLGSRVLELLCSSAVGSSEVIIRLSFGSAYRCGRGGLVVGGVWGEYFWRRAT